MKTLSNLVLEIDSYGEKKIIEFSDLKDEIENIDWVGTSKVIVNNVPDELEYQVSKLVFSKYEIFENEQIFEKMSELVWGGN